MAKATYWQRGDAVDYTNGGSAKIEANEIIVFGTKIGVAGTDIAVGEMGSLIVAGVFELPKASGAITAGAAVYWSATNSNVTTTSTNNTLAGFAVAAAESAAETVLVKINA
jgi:predicted RecA/RadA family phage recombinase